MPCLKSNRSDWFVRETLGYLRRTFSRLDVSSRSIFAIIEPGSCFAGTLLELALAADRSYMLDAENGPEDRALGAELRRLPDGQRPVAGSQAHFCGEVPGLPKEQPLIVKNAKQLGLVTSTPDDIDWEDEVRIAIEERASLSPDALTGMEASLRFAGPETMLTRVFGRLTAWQNWIFIRPERGRRAGRPQGLRHGRQGEIQLGTSLMSGINYSEKIPNNVNLDDRPHAAARARALAAAVPRSGGSEHGPDRLPGRRRLPAHRDLGRRATAGRNTAR